MALTLTTPGQVNQIVCMDGTAAILEAIHSPLAFAMGGSVTTAALLGATAPKVGAAWYTSCKIPPTGLITAGQAFSILFVCNTPWDGASAVAHRLFESAVAWNQDRLSIGHDGGGSLLINTMDHANHNKWTKIPVTALTWPINTTVTVLATLAADNTQDIYLNGSHAGLTSWSEPGLREVALENNLWFGSSSGGTDPIEGAILCAIWGRVLTAGEIAALSPPATWASVIDLPQLTVTGLSTGNAVRLYDAAGNIHSYAVEAGGTATLNYTLD